MRRDPAENARLKATLRRIGRDVARRAVPDVYAHPILRNCKSYTVAIESPSTSQDRSLYGKPEVRSTRIWVVFRELLSHSAARREGLKRSRDE